MSAGAAFGALLAFACVATRPGAGAAVGREAARARAAGARRRALEETALMLVVYAGFPAALEAFRALARAWPARPAARPEASRAAWRRRGAALCRRVYAGAYPRLVARVRALHPHLAAWMEETGYGRVLSRPGLTARERELIAVAVLTATGWRRQLTSHLLGAAHVGARPREIDTSIAAGLAAGGSREVVSRAVAAARQGSGTAAATPRRARSRARRTGV